MKKYGLIAIFFPLLTACGSGGLGKIEQHKAMLSQKFQAQSCNISSTGGSELSITLTNVNGGIYTDLPFSRFASCVVYEYSQVVSDSVLDHYYSISVAVTGSQPNGPVKTSFTNAEAVLIDRVERMISSYSVCLAYFNEAWNAQTFRAGKQYLDTLVLNDSILLSLDSVVKPFFANKISTQHFFGYEEFSAIEEQTVWIRMNDGTKVNVYRFVLDMQSGFIAGIHVND